MKNWMQAGPAATEAAGRLADHARDAGWTHEELDWDPHPAVRQQIASPASGGFLTEARSGVLLGPPGTGKTHLATGLGSEGTGLFTS